MSELARLKVKVLRDGVKEWVHFSYVPQRTKKLFDETVNQAGLTPSVWVTKWATMDFGCCDLHNYEGLEKLKSNIKKMYSDMYPDIYLESESDKQGWVRVWVTNHMKKEIEKHEK